MRTTMRLGRGLYVTGGGGVFAAAFAFAMMRGIVTLVLAAVFVALVAAATLAKAAHQRSPSTRRLLALRALAMSVDPSLVRIRGDRSDPSVVGLYVVGSAFFTGPHPRKRIDLERLYPSRANQLACVGYFPDAVTANAAKRRLLRNRFSASELNALFLPE